MRRPRRSPILAEPSTRGTVIALAALAAAGGVAIVIAANQGMQPTATTPFARTGPLPQVDPQVATDYVDPPGAHEPRPTVHVGGADSRSSIPGGVLVRANGIGGSPFRYAGVAQMTPGPAPYSAYRFPTGSITANLTTGVPYRIAFVADVNALEIATVGDGARIHVRVDGAAVAKIQLPRDGSSHLIRLGWNGPLRQRRILIECSNGTAFGGVRVPRGQQIAPPASPAGPRMIVVGDSWTDGTGSDGINDHAYIAGQLLGIMDTWVAGVGGTGYLQDSAQGQHIGARISSDIIAHRPDIVVFCYGADDTHFAPAQVASAAAADWRKVKAALPRVRIIVQGPWPATGANVGAAADYSALDKALRTAAENQGLPYVSPVQRAWVRGTGYTGHENSSGNSDTMIGPDGIHPTQSGHDHVGRLEAAAWRPFLSAFFPKR